MNTSKIKKGLGRGLSSLIGETKTEININKVSISDLLSNKFQPRKIFDEESLQDLTNSIKERGIIQPIIVRKSSEDSSKYEIIAGERRWLSAQKAGLHEVPVVITDVDDLKSLEFAIIENVQRNDLNAIEEARGYQRLIDEFSYDQEKVAQFIGKSRSHIANFLRLLSLPEVVLKLIETQKLTVGHAKILVGLDNADFIANKIVEKNLSVRQSENFVKIFKTKKHSLKTYKDANPDLNSDFIFSYPAYNVRNNEIGGIMGLSQLKRLDHIIKRRTENLIKFITQLDSKKYRVDFKLEGSSNYAFNLILIKPDIDFVERLMKKMTSSGIEFRRGSAGGGNQTRQPYVKELLPKNFFLSLKETEHIHFFGFYIGNFPDLKDSEIDDICNIVNSVN